MGRCVRGRGVDIRHTYRQQAGSLTRRRRREACGAASSVAPAKTRCDLALGLFYAGAGFARPAGAVITGLLYEQSSVALVSSAVAVHLAIPVLVLARRHS